MGVAKYLEGKIIFLIINISSVAFSAILLKAFNVNLNLIIFTTALNLTGGLIFYIFDYFSKSNYFKEVIKNLENLDKKYLISDITEKADFLEGRILNEIIKKATKSMNDEISQIKRNIDDYREYIELWVHEVKTPIAASKLIIENNKSEVTKSIEEEINKIDNYIEQALFYTRSNSTEKDYIIKKYKLRTIVNKVIRRNASVFIAKRIHIETENLDQEIYSDSKWLEFILNQIMINSIKYMNKEEKKLKIYAENLGENVILNIQDNGIGIAEKDIVKIFEKGYTGENGRIFSKSTGMGLYLCKKLCDNLGLGIKIASEEGVGTIVSINFSINKMLIFQ
ncbi:sensor histidine kinase [Clostridium isatidis]|uniref:sensor histidine kinase n=1 Tax=Clostridium isatidis TaxID=182773 RepID=UPI003AB0CC2E